MFVLDTMRELDIKQPTLEEHDLLAYFLKIGVFLEQIWIEHVIIVATEVLRVFRSLIFPVLNLYILVTHLIDDVLNYGLTFLHKAT